MVFLCKGMRPRVNSGMQDKSTCMRPNLASVSGRIPPKKQQKAGGQELQIIVEKFRLLGGLRTILCSKHPQPKTPLSH